MQQVAGAESQHARQYGPRGIDVRHQVHIPNLLPRVVRDFRSTSHAKDARVRAEEIDRTERIDSLSYEANNVGFATHIHRDCQPAYFLGHRFGAFGIEVGHDHTSCTFSSKATTEHTPDAAA